MESAELKQILLSAVNASISAGVEILKIYKSDFKVELKDDNSPLTLADKKSNDIIYDALASFGIPFLSEEGKEIKMLIYFRVRETDVNILLNKDTQRPLAPMQSLLIESIEGLYY